MSHTRYIPHITVLLHFIVANAVDAIIAVVYIVIKMALRIIINTILSQ